MNLHNDTVEPESLIRYLRDLAQLRLRPILHVDSYEFVMWFDDVPAHRACQSAVVAGQLDDQPEWLIVDRVDLPQRPTPPDQVAPWIRTTLDDPSNEPELRDVMIRIEDVDTGDGPVPTEVEDPLADHPVVVRAWDAYLDRWRDWSTAYTETLPVHQLYTELFRAAERARQVGEQFETVVAVGLVAVQGERGRIKRHLLTAPARIALDAQTGRITVEPSGEMNSAVRLEQDMLAPSETPPADVQALVRDQLRDLDPLDLETVAPALEAWTNAASADARFESDLSSDLSPGADLVVRLAPALITRPRSQQAVVDTYDAILDAIRDGAEAPATFADLTTTGGGDLTDAERAASGLDLDSEQWFPLPANDEQARIVEALRTRRGVIVHGPPGTGKSHTIANLISHALATGQRVLVTAHSARALEVLSDKLPDDIRSLTVTMLGEGRRGTDDLERSANEILRRRQAAEWQPAEIHDRLRHLEQHLGRLREERRELLAQLGAARAKETDSVELGFGGFHGTLAQLAHQLAAAPPAPTWLEGEPTGSPPLTDEELAELIALQDQLAPDDLALSEIDLPPIEAVVDPDRAAAAIAVLEAATARVAEFTDISSELLDQLEQLSEEATGAYLAAARAERDAAHAVERRNSDWLNHVLADLDRGQTARWHTLWGQASEFLNAGWDLASLDRLQVTVPSADLIPRLRAQADGLANFFRDGGKLRRIKPKPVKDAQELLDSVTVNGTAPDTLEACGKFLRWCDVHASISLVERSWPPGAISPQPTLVLRSTAIVEAVQALADCFALRDRRAELAAVIEAHQIDTGLLPGRADLVERALAASASHAERFAAHTELLGHVAQLNSVARLRTAHALVGQLVGALEAGDEQRYRELYAELEETRRRRSDVDRYTQLVGLLRAALPDGAALVEAGKGEELVPFEHQWDLARARRWLQGVESLDANSITQRIAALNDRVRDAITQMGANRAWLHAISRLTDAHTQHLKAYQTAMKRVGKGNSKYDYKYRQEARAHLAQCQDAVPAWVMPAHQVAANVAPVPDTFDLVIIDEASQSGVEELFLFWLGKQVVVVGDKHQISPEGSFVKGEAQDLQRRHLEGWSFAGEFGPENSLFDVAEVKYVAGEVWLSEHFRSMPEIIEYSNQLCYADHRLEPVRQFGTDRLPPLCSTLVPHVPDGRASTAKVNRDEADALVAQLIECLDDPQYVRDDGTPMTFGVISLLGTQQAKLIQQQLLLRVDPEQWVERRIHVGDAADFQGDERDVVFLSMVTTPPPDGRRIAKLGHDRDLRRFNVAASRARDQLWLFHSVDLDRLNPECPRARLLAHIRNPTRAGLDGYSGEVDPDELRPPFDSLFEQRVFLDLVNRGYVVEPQWKVLGYRIDLVIVGTDSRLAVECDGDAWHGPDRYTADLTRQGDLERVGWTFVRIKEWEYYADKSAALAPLWAALERLDIGPGGARVDPPAPTPPPATHEAEDADVRSLAGASPPPPHLTPPPFTGSWAPPAATTTLPSPPPAFGSAAAAPPLLPDSPSGPAARDVPDVTDAVIEAGHREQLRDVVPSGTAPTDPSAAEPSAPQSDLRPIDPLSAPSSQLLHSIRLIVGVEGPVVVERVFHLMNDAAGYQRLGARIRAALLNALEHGLRDGSLVAEDPLSQGLLLATVRLPEQPDVDVRPKGERDFSHIPPREIAERLRQLQRDTGLTGHDLYRRCHLEYGFSRLRETTAEHYAACAALAAHDGGT